MNISLKVMRAGKPGIVSVRARIFGLLAVHKSWPSRGFFVISHIPTGLSIYQGFISKAKAEKVAIQLKHLDWDFKSPKSA